MSNLFWRSESGELAPLAGAEFQTEAELERYLYANPQLLGELVVISRQTKAGNHDIPDLIAVDTDGNVVIIELKKGTVTEAVIPQVLSYAIWAETNPDSIKALWLECDNKPDELEINWDSLEIRIMIVAANIPAAVLRLVNRIGYPTELVEISRFSGESGEFVLVNLRTPEPVPKNKPAAGRRVWDEKWYRENYDPTSVDEFIGVVKRVERMVRKHDWQLEPKMNKNYVGFKYGFFNAFGVQWLGSKSFGLFFKLQKDVADSLDLSGVEGVRYVEGWKQLECKINAKDYPVDDLTPVFEAAYKQVAGKST
jgi:hypothetical protein